MPETSPPQADAWLRHGEEGLRLLAENTRDVFYVTSPDARRLLYVSPAYEEVWGRSRESLYRQLSSFLEAIHPEDRPRVAAALRRQAAGHATDQEYRIVRAQDGAMRWIHDRALPVRDGAGRLYRIVGIAADVTDRRRAEEVLRLLSDASWALGASLDPAAILRSLARLVVPRLADVCVIDVLEEGERVRRLEVAHADPAWDQRLKALSELHPPRLVNERHPLERALATGEPQLIPALDEAALAAMETDPERLEVLRQLGLVSCIVAPLVARGRILGALTLATSHSGWRYGAEDLALAAELARRAALAVDNASLYEAALLANKAKSDFLAVVSHELRTPLTAIIGYADLLALGVGGDLNPLQTKRVERIKSGAWHLVQLIEEILSYTRLETSREKVRREPVDVARVVRDSKELVEPAAAEKRLDLVCDLPEGPVFTLTDGAKIKQMVLNLLSNAVKFTERGQVRVALATEGEALTIMVADTGIGIEPAHAERIFEAFWQVEQPHTRRVGGTGLGLSVTRRLARLLGGDVTVASAPGEGSTFTVRLPLERPAPQPGEAPAREP